MYKKVKRPIVDAYGFAYSILYAHIHLLFTLRTLTSLFRIHTGNLSKI